jgi:hypothetical protein
LRKRSIPRVETVLALAALLLADCQQQWVSPYSPELQKRAADMLAEVAGWEGQMRNASGTAAADPRHPEVQAKLNKWSGDIEVMATIELAIDPSSTSCDKFVAAIGGPVTEGIARVSSTMATVSSSLGAASSGSYCESLPDIFDRMKTQVNERFPRDLAEQCKLPWLSDQYFETLAEARATAGMPSSARAQTSLQPANSLAPTAEQEVLAKRRCGALFELGDGPAARRIHGDLVSPLVVELDAIIYREGRQAPTGAK